VPEALLLEPPPAPLVTLDPRVLPAPPVLPLPVVEALVPPPLELLALLELLPPGEGASGVLHAIHVKGSKASQVRERIEVRIFPL